MNSSLELLNSTARTLSENEPRLNLLYEPEPRFRLFLSNLSAVLRPGPRVATTSPPGQFWPDVFVNSPVPWSSVVESIAYHMLLVMAVWGISLGSAPRKPLQQRRVLAHSSITYYPPSYPAQTSAPPKFKPKPPSHSGSSRQAAMPVAPERRGGASALVTPPDLKAALAPPKLNPGSSTLPAMPVDATGRPTQKVAGLSSVVAPPPPEVSNSAMRAGGLLATSVVAPPPEIGGVAGRRAGGVGPGSAVVAPPPALQGSAHRLGALGAGSSTVVAPAPDLPAGQRSGLTTGRGLGGPGAVVPPPVQDASAAGGGNGNRRVGSLAGSGAPVVPPPPSLGAGASGGPGGLMDPFANNSASVVPPPPSMQPGGGSPYGRTLGALAGNGPQAAVAPPPSLQSGGRSAAGASHLSGLGGSGTQAIPPPPSLQAGGGNSGGGRGGFGSLSGGGTQVVPPPPSVQSGAGIKSLGSGNAGTLAGTPNGTGIVPPPPSVQGGGGGAGAGHLGSLGGSGTQVVPPPPGIQTVSSSSGTGGGNGTAGGIGTLNGTGAQVVPPPPSVAGSAGAGSRAGGGLGNMPGGGGQVAGPPGPVQMASTAGKPLLPVDDPPEASPTIPAQPAMAEPPPGPGLDVPLRVIPLPWSATKTSFFSNYEVFLAERRVGKNQTELIKLVYTFLPYQHRLSEYLAEGQVFKKKEYKLRVYRDPGCDESLLHMTFPDTDQPPPNDNFAASLGIPKGKDNTLLPCFRLSADDYRRATMH